MARGAYEGAYGKDTNRLWQRILDLPVLRNRF
jgi:hypothetical protein